LCARFVEQGGSFAEHERERIAATLCRIDPMRLDPGTAGRLLRACADRIDCGNAWMYGPMVARAGAEPLKLWAQADPATCIALLGCDACAALVACAELESLWDWSIERDRADLIQSLMALNLSAEGKRFRQSLVERWMAALLRVRRDALREQETLSSDPVGAKIT
jgi:hypothetical protein